MCNRSLSLYLALVVSGAILGGCAVTDSDIESQSAEDAVTSAASAVVLSVSGIEGEDVASPGRFDTCTNGQCQFAYLAGTSLTITPDGRNATADCLQFASWSGACAGQGATCNLVINSALSVRSVWTRRPGCVPQ